GGGNTYNSASTMRGMVVSPSGNVYVSGHPAVTSSESRDFVTVKYNSSGNFQWVKRFNYTAIDQVSDMTIDQNENIFITGTSIIPSVQTFAVTVKYNSSGDSLWTNIYSHKNFQNNIADKIILDESGEMYVSVYYYTGNNIGHGIIKVNSSGTLQWYSSLKSFCTPNSIKEDTEGNIYITGFGGFNQSMWDYITMKCDSSGNIKWIRTYNGPANENDQAYDIEIDHFGNVYVTGGSTGIGTNHDFATIKYDSLGTEQWVLRYNGPGFDSDIAGHLTIDPDGNIYVSGSSLNPGTSYDIATIKYNDLGQLQWVRRYNGTANGNDMSQGLGVDLSGNVFVTGTSDSTGTGSDYVTIKYNPSGNAEWIRRYNGSADDADIVSSLSLDLSGNVYVTGWSFGNGTQSDYATVKYNTNGTEQWAARWDDPANSFDYANEAAVDENGNVFVTGISQGMGTDNDYTTVKYNSSGQQQWAVPFNGQSNGSDIGSDIALDYLGDVYVTGYSNNTDQYSTIKYDDQGVEQWNIDYSLPDYLNSTTDLLVDNSGNVIVSGYSNKPGEEWVWSIVKYKQPGFIPSDVEITTIPPTELVLYQNYPNPFNPSTRIIFSIPNSEHVLLKVYNILGTEVTTLVNEKKLAGKYEVEFNAFGLSSGVYFYTLQTGSYSQTKKLILLR
ncbi:MAG: SBBP repeat-containing protein, partial [Nitrososphaerales archaeon]